jgi:hypothetical protein
LRGFADRWIVGLRPKEIRESTDIGFSRKET